MALPNGPLSNVSGVGDPVSVLQTDLQIINRDLYNFTGHYQSGSETTLIGPPTAGTFLEDARWVDAWMAHWRCTVAGSPGTWRQETAAIRAGEPGSGVIPTGYLILDSSDNYVSKLHGGSYAWTPVTPQFFEFDEIADADAPASNKGRIYMRDTGGKTELVARFPTGAIQQIAIEP